MVWERYWRYIETIHIDQGSYLARYFVADVFQGGRVSCRGLSMIKGELRLWLDNTYAMNQVHELHGDEWACSNIERSDFATQVVFRGVDSLDLRTGARPRMRYYSFSEIAARGRRYQIILYLTDAPDVDCAYLRLSFEAVTVEDISSRMRKCEQTAGRKFQLRLSTFPSHTPYRGFLRQRQSIQGNQPDSR
jgi:hypothetical protein